LDIARLQAAIIVNDAAITAANLQKSANQTNLWVDYMNWMLQGCGSLPMATLEQPEKPAVIAPPLEELLNPSDDILAGIESNLEAALLLKKARETYPELVKPRDIVGIGPG
jgi:hypothetical protein